MILTLANSIEFEGELKLRLQGIAATVPGAKIPTTMYIGMFAGASKPKPFQRKRPNLSQLLAGKLPPLNDMRKDALQLNKGSYKPCPPGESRRIELALQHIYEGFNTFHILRVRGPPGVSNQWRPEAVLQLKDEMLVFKPMGSQVPSGVEFAYEDLLDWSVVDNDHIIPNDSGIEITTKTGETFFFCFAHVRDVKHTLEFYWNRYQVTNSGSVKRGSTHGRPLVSVATLSGEVPATESPVGLTEVIDQASVAELKAMRCVFELTQDRDSTNPPPIMTYTPAVSKVFHFHHHYSLEL